MRSRRGSRTLDKVKLRPEAFCFPKRWTKMKRVRRGHTPAGNGYLMLPYPCVGYFPTPLAPEACVRLPGLASGKGSVRGILYVHRATGSKHLQTAYHLPLW